MITDFDGWRDGIFDRPVAGEDEAPWYFSKSGLDFNPEAHPKITLEWIARLFTQSRELPGRFGVAQVGQGMWFLIDPSASRHMFVLTNPAVDIEARQHAIDSIYTLYRDLFEPCCGHWADGRLLDDICAAFWDVAPFAPTGNEAVPTPQDQAFLGVLRRIAHLHNPVCLKSLAVACDHWRGAYPAQMGRIVGWG